MKIVLVGNPNTGKTTLLNSLCSADEHTGNWHGVTVDSKEKSYKLNGKIFNVIDLPGVYSLSPLSFEEKVTCDYLYNNNDFIINVLDASNLYRNFYLTLELLKLNRPMLIVINKTSSNYIYNFNVKKIKEFLNINVVEIDAQNNQDVKKLKQEIYKCKYENMQNVADIKIKIDKNLVKNGLKIENLLQKIKNLINLNENNLKINLDFITYKCLQNDINIIKKLNLSQQKTKQLNDIICETSLEEISSYTYSLIEQIFKSCNVKKQNRVFGKSKIDKLILNKYLCLPIFCLTLLTVFYLTFFSVGKFLGSVFSNFITNIVGVPLTNLISSVTSSNVICDFFETAIIGGVGSVFSFLPQVVILFLCLGILEDSGYLSRLAFCLDDIFSKIGLSGKSVYTLLMGFGCNGIAVCTAKTMQDKNSQIKTAMLAPYMSCSAKLPIYSVIGLAFFGASNVFVIFAMYLVGVLVAMLLSLFYEKTFLKSKQSGFILEFPQYRTVSFKKIKSSLISNTKQFLIRIATVLISVNIIVWVLGNFTFGFNYIGNNGGQSMLTGIGKVLSPIFAPLGFGNWGASSAIIAGLVAKEIIVSSIAMFNGVSINNLSSSLRNPASAVCFTPASAISFMIFCLLYNPCLATLGILKKEIGKKWFIISSIVQFAIAYLISFLVYNCVNIVLNKGILFLIIMLFVLLLLSYSIYFVTKKRKRCFGCKRCK